MRGSPHQAAIIGVGSSAIERSSDRGIAAFAVDAALAALRDAGIDRDEIDGYVGAPSATSGAAVHIEGADEISVRLMAKTLGLTKLVWSADLFWDFTPSMLVAASHALAAGDCRTLLVVRALHDLRGVASPRPLSQAPGEAQFEAPFGYRSAGARFAMQARRYMHDAGMTRRDLFEVVALSRDHASRNPLAIWRDKSVHLETYLSAPMVADPLCRFDCDMPVCGAVAFVVTRADEAEAPGRRPVYLSGSSQWQQPERIFERSGRTRADVDLVQLYDGFSTMPLEWLERLGWCDAHTGWRFLRDGAGRLDGALPFNTFGGSLGEGRLHGAGHVREAVLQLSGRAEGRQVAKAENCLVQVGPSDFSSLVMLSSSPG